MPTNTPRCPELLAPAGGHAALLAAVANGADAVYLGVESLNARRGAENFTLESLADACSFAHLRGRRVYLTANILVLPEEMDDAIALVDGAWAVGVDAVIVQDIGLLWAMRRVLPHVRVHASTQINSHNTLTLQALARLGVKRVTLAREVSIEEIGVLAEAPVEVETFVHGALCVCYSGQCLMSSLIGRRSANRGTCAQPCRLPYELVDVDGAVVETPGVHLLSPKDLAGVSVLGRLARTGVSALKIEGRMKSAEYVALVTGVYRGALDRAFADPDGYAAREGELSVLSESFSRGFTEAYLLGERGSDMMSYRRPNNRGVLLGRVTAVEGRSVTVALESALESQDTLEFWTGAGRFAQPAGALRIDGVNHTSAPAGKKVTLTADEPVSAGDRVFRVRNAALSEAAARTFADANLVAPIGLHFTARVVDGEPLRVEVSDDAGRSGSACGAPIEAARTKAVTAEEIAEHLGRLGGTPYRIDSFDLDLTPAVGVGFSALHRVRREAIADYEASVLAPWSGRRRVASSAPLPSEVRWGDRTPRLVARVADEQAAAACLEAGADAAYVPSSALGTPRALQEGVVAVLPRICHDRETPAALAWALPGNRVAVGNLGLVPEAARLGAQVEADWGLNAMNPEAVAQLAELGAGFVWLSPELSGRQVAEVVAASSVPTGITVLGRQELMVTEHCVLSAVGPCDRHCGACDRRKHITTLRDRKGYEFPVRTDPLGRSHVYNAVPLDLTAALPEIIRAGVAGICVDVSLDEPADAAAAVGRMRAAREREMLGVEPGIRAKSAATTSGHFYRGVL